MKPIDQLKQLARNAMEDSLTFNRKKESFISDAYYFHLGKLHEASIDGLDSERIKTIRENCFSYVMNFDPYSLFTIPLSAEAAAQRLIAAQKILNIIDNG